MFVFSVCVCPSDPQVHEPHETPPGAGETEQRELGKSHHMSALLPPVHDSVPAAVPHRECSQLHRIFMYESFQLLHKVIKYDGLDK